MNSQNISPRLRSPQLKGLSESFIETNHIETLKLPSSYFHFPVLRRSASKERKIQLHFFKRQFLKLEIIQDKVNVTPRSKIMDFQHFKFLTVLNISDCRLRSINSLRHSMGSLLFLNASKNLITSLPFLPNLEQLFISYNELKTLQNVRKCKRMRVIDIAFNRIQDPSEIESLGAQLNSLKAIRLEGNPLKLKNLWLFTHKAFGKSVNCQPSLSELIFSYSTWSRRMVIIENYKTKDERSVVLKQEQLSELQLKQLEIELQDKPEVLTLIYGSEAIPQKEGDSSCMNMTTLSEMNVTSTDRIDQVKGKPYVWPEPVFKTQVDKVNDFKSLIKNTLVMIKEEEPLKRAARKYFCSGISEQRASSFDKSYLKPENQIKELIYELIKLQNDTSHHSSDIRSEAGVQSQSIELLNYKDKDPSSLMQIQSSDMPTLPNSCDHSPRVSGNLRYSNLLRNAVQNVTMGQGGVGEMRIQDRDPALIVKAPLLEREKKQKQQSKGQSLISRREVRSPKSGGSCDNIKIL